MSSPWGYVLENSEMRVPMPGNDAIPYRARHCGTRQVSGAAAKLVLIVTFYNVELRIEPRNNHLSRRVSALGRDIGHAPGRLSR